MKSIFKIFALTIVLSNSINAQEAEAYMHASYQGARLGVSASFTSLDGDYYCEEGWINLISSIRVPSGWYVEIYDKRNYEGDSYTLSSSIEDLGTIGWNDRIKSIKVMKDGMYLSGAKCPCKKNKKKEPIGPKDWKK